MSDKGPGIIIRLLQAIAIGCIIAAVGLGTAGLVLMLREALQ